MRKIEKQRINEKAFDDYRDILNHEFLSERPFRRNRVTQGLFWTDLEKDLANQYIREEAWIFGWKYRDNLKLVDHCADNEDSKAGRIGF